MARRGHLRASDQDRENVAERLRQASLEGRLLTDELEQRLSTAFSARTYGELDALLDDLPGRGLVGRRRERSTLATVARPALAVVILVSAACVLLATAVFVFASVFALWMVWVPLAWWYFTHRGRRYAAVHRRHHGAHHYRGTSYRRGGWQV